MATSTSVVLIAIKLLHTGIWAILAACILALPALAMVRRFDLALAASVLVILECGVLALNQGRCPLTNLAERYTSVRLDNFDIYLPRWLARHNKLIFGSLFLAGEFVVLWRWFS